MPMKRGGLEPGNPTEDTEGHMPFKRVETDDTATDTEGNRLEPGDGAGAAENDDTDDTEGNAAKLRG